MNTAGMEDFLDRLVSDYSDRLARGERPDRAAILNQVPPDHRPGLERCLKMLDAGTAHAPAAGMVLGPGVNLGKYSILHELGRGGMSMVYLAHDEELRRPVALKVLRPGLALEQIHIDRFHREAMAVAKLKHPHVVPVFDVGEQNGFHYLAMEYVEGPSLSTVIEALPRERAPTAEDLARATANPSLAHDSHDFERAVGQLLAPIADALSAAHAAGLIHRDVKPSNILIHKDGRAVISDFGLAKGDDDASLSLTGDPIGTPYYMSPEQARIAKENVDHRTDVYSLGVTLYEMLGGRRPFEGETVMEVLEAIRNTRPPSLRSVTSHCSRSAAALVRKAMAFDQKDRYGDMGELGADLVLLSQGRGTQAAADEGGLIRRAFTQLSYMSSGYPYEYKSARKVMGMPLVHINVGVRVPGQDYRHARGWLAVGTTASGGVAIGGAASFGLLAVAGGASSGLISFAGGVSASLLWAVAGGLAIGGVATAGFAFGLIAIGGMAFGVVALGGRAEGYYAAGGEAKGTYVVCEQQKDPEAVNFFAEWLPWIFNRYMDNGGS